MDGIADELKQVLVVLRRSGMLLAETVSTIIVEAQSVEAIPLMLTLSCCGVVFSQQRGSRPLPHSWNPAEQGVG